MSENKVNDHLKYSILNKITFIWYMCPQGWSEYESFTSDAKKKSGRAGALSTKAFLFQFSMVICCLFQQKNGEGEGLLKTSGSDAYESFRNYSMIKVGLIYIY